MPAYCVTPDWPVTAKVSAFVTTRWGGLSTGPYATWNLAGHTDDAGHCVARNRALLRERCGLPAATQWLHQVHGDQVVRVDPQTVQSTPAADGAFLNQSKTAAVVLSADCLPVLLADPQGREAAVLHGGWRSLAQQIIAKALAQFTTPVAELVAWLGPGIGPGRFEVGAEVKAAFVDLDPALAAAFYPALRPGKCHGHLARIAHHQLRAL